MAGAFNVGSSNWKINCAVDQVFGLVIADITMRVRTSIVSFKEINAGLSEHSGPINCIILNKSWTWQGTVAHMCLSFKVSVSVLKPV